MLKIFTRINLPELLTAGSLDVKAAKKETTLAGQKRKAKEDGVFIYLLPFLAENLATVTAQTFQARVKELRDYCKVAIEGPAAQMFAMGLDWVTSPACASLIGAWRSIFELVEIHGANASDPAVQALWSVCNTSQAKGRATIHKGRVEHSNRSPEQKSQFYLDKLLEIVERVAEDATTHGEEIGLAITGASNYLAAVEKASEAVTEATV